MVESVAGPRQSVRVLVALLGVLALAIVAALGPDAAGAAAAPAAEGQKPLPIPTSFQLPATDGYTLYVVGEPAREGDAPRLRVIVGKKGREVEYQAPATVTETSMHAGLGDVGEVSVDFERSGKAASVLCDKEKILYDSGSWVGTIDFHGEEGFAEVDAGSAPGNVELLLGPFCGGLSGGRSGPVRGADLYVRNPGLGAHLDVYKHRPGAAALITARYSEYVDGIAIERSLSERMPGRDFSYDPQLRTATVAPPGRPFAGTARFALGKKAGQRWSGDLSVDMPGRADVALTGPLLRAELSPSE